MFKQATKANEVRRLWPTTSNPPNLKVDEVHVWRTSLERDGPSFELLRKTLVPEEAARADRFRFNKHRRHFIVARACLRTLLGYYLGRPAGAIDFSYDEYGKPSLQESINKPGLRFNLAHSGNWAVYGITIKREIGIDIERFNAVINYAEVARRRFSKEEARHLNKLPAALRQEAFFNCWTRKEAVIKADGRGLSLPLDQFEVAVAPDEPVAIKQMNFNDPNAKRWTLATLNVDFGYAAALAVEGDNWRLYTWHFNEAHFQGHHSKALS